MAAEKVLYHIEKKRRGSAALSVGHSCLVLTITNVFIAARAFFYVSVRMKYLLTMRYTVCACGADDSLWEPHQQISNVESKPEISDFEPQPWGHDTPTDRPKK